MSTKVGSVRRALLSVSNKTGLTFFAQSLAELNVKIVASGGTGRAIDKAGIRITTVSDFTGSPEILDGRVKTLHPRVHAGILADRSNESHLRELAERDHPPLDLVVCNLYPFAEMRDRHVDHREMVENIDIGGPTLVRSAAKNAEGGVTVVVDPADYASVLEHLRRDGVVSLQERRRLAAKAFRHVAEYDRVIAEYFDAFIDKVEPQEPSRSTIQDNSQPAKATRHTEVEPRLPQMIPPMRQSYKLRYGENPHQAGALYRFNDEPHGIAHSELIAGKALSYTNLLDLDGAYRASWLLNRPGCAIVKHTNPCGMAEASSQPEAFRRAFAGDPLSAFGGVIAFNSKLELETAEAIRESKLFVECIVAPDLSTEAVDAFKKRENLRLVRIPPGDPNPSFGAHRIGGGMLVQHIDLGLGDRDDWKIVTKHEADKACLDELAFAMTVAMTLKSNAIAITRERALLGAGAGFMSRVDAVRQALYKAEDSRGGFLASDAFFPFPDSIELAAEAGIVAIIQPGGSKRDNEVIDACNANGIAMVFASRRHFRH